MLKIAICYDMPEELEKISLNIHRYIKEHKLDAQVSEFSHPDALLTASEETSYNLFLLDIVMPMLSGIDVGRELRRRHSSAQIVYLTTSDEFAVSAFSVKAAHYLTKPFTADAFNEAIDRTLENLRLRQPKELAVHGDDGALRMLKVNDIEYIECRDHALEIHLKNETMTEQRRVLARLKEELDALVPGQFIAPYKGYIVNQRAIVRIETAGILLMCGARIPIPRGSCRQLQAQYTAFRFTKKEGTL